VAKVSEGRQLEQWQVKPNQPEVSNLNRSEPMQATLERDRSSAPKRKFYIRLKLEVGMRPISAEPQPEQPHPLERAKRQQQAEQHSNTMREATFRRLKLG
jgi:hypothetical protein